ncbi:hypothetical protein V1508DRAFT_398932 [Lipomyces doorenjongii]|uniref:uncharacterized protein n=1 Tax=Lipomyces doorenjongii TaxID=383834 RepID=UPI0034CD3986
MPPDENMSPEPVVDQAAWFSPPVSAGSGMSSATFEYASPELANQRTRIEDAPVHIVEYGSAYSTIGQTSSSGSRKRKLSQASESNSPDQRKQFWTEVTRELSQEWSLVSGISDSGASRSLDSDSWFSIQVHPQTSPPTPNSGKSFFPSLNTSEDQQRADGGDDADKMLYIR